MAASSVLCRVSFLLAAAAAGCSASYTGVDSPDDGGGVEASPGDDGAVDAGSDGDEPADSATDAESGGSTLLVNGDFETNCAGWATTNATFQITSQMPHGGKSACRACPLTTGAMGVSQTVPVPLGTQTLLMTAWVRTETPGTTIRAEVVLAAAETGASRLKFEDVTASLAWMSATLAVTPDPNAARATVSFSVSGTDAAMSGCIALDDVLLGAAP